MCVLLHITEYSHLTVKQRLQVLKIVQQSVVQF